MNNLEIELKAIREICKDNNFSEEELLHRARLLYFINRLDFGKEMPMLLGLIQYEVEKKKSAHHRQKTEMSMQELFHFYNLPNSKCYDSDSLYEVLEKMNQYKINQQK